MTRVQIGLMKQEFSFVKSGTAGEIVLTILLLYTVTSPYLGSAYMDSVNHRSKIFGKKIEGCICIKHVQTFILQTIQHNNYLCSITLLQVFKSSRSYLKDMGRCV